MHGLVLTLIFIQSSEGKTIFIDTIACCNHVAQPCLVNIVHLPAKHVNGGCGDVIIQLNNSVKFISLKCWCVWFHFAH